MCGAFIKDHHRWPMEIMLFPMRSEDTDEDITESISKNVTVTICLRL
jgi:hypothetical protein